MKEPHRALIDTVLDTRRRQQDWLAGDGPQPGLPAQWGSLWRAATARHVELTDADEYAARDAVASVVNHVGDLDAHLAWFRDDDRRRDRAIAETLLYATGLSLDVPSRAAQEAWAQRWSGDGALPDWLDAWGAWSLDFS